MLNEYLINHNMFQQSAEKDPQEQLRDEVSLNFTVSSRSSKPKKEQLSFPDITNSANKCESIEIINIAAKQLHKFSQWLEESETKYDSSHETINEIINELERYECNSVSEEYLQMIKSQLFKKQQDGRSTTKCKKCEEMSQKILELEHIMKNYDQQLEKMREENSVLELRYKEEVFTSLKEELLTKTQLRILENQIKDLQIEVNNLKNEKTVLEKTILFNKTKNSELFMRLEKSKGLSGGKNSTNSSQINRHHQTILFIDPIEQDVDEWIKFFTIQKNKFSEICLKEKIEKERDLNRVLTKEEQNQLYNEGKVFILLKSIKQVLKNLTKIRQHTPSFAGTENAQDKGYNIQAESTSFLVVKEQNERLLSKTIKLQKINETLLQQKQNLVKTNCHLKQQYRKQFDILAEMKQKCQLMSQQNKILKENVANLTNVRSKVKQQIHLREKIDNFIRPSSRGSSYNLK